MANEKQLALLKESVEKWNDWREENPEAKVDLSGADLSEADLRRAYLRGACLVEANLSGANLSFANLRGADFNGTNLRGGKLLGADLTGAKLRGADLSSADFSTADLSIANLRDANLDGTELLEANLSSAYLEGSDFSNTLVGDTVFADLDLRQVKGLDKTQHLGPSTIGTNTIAESLGKIPDVFLRGCGLSDWEIEMAKLYNPDLSNDQRNQILYRVYDLQASQAIQVSPLFISYSHGDSQFVDKIGDCLTKKGIRYWRDIHDMKAGRLEKQIDTAIRQNPTVLLILSKNSLNSDWVEHEARTARALEKDLGRDVLCPVALDDSWKDSRWPKHVMEQILEYNILDFSAWQDNNRFDGTFRKLIDGLELFYKRS